MATSMKAKGKTVEEGRVQNVATVEGDKWPEMSKVRVPKRVANEPYEGHRIDAFEGGEAVAGFHYFDNGVARWQPGLRYKVLTDDPKYTRSKNLVLMGTPLADKEEYERNRMKIREMADGSRKRVVEMGDLTQEVYMGSPIDPEAVTALDLEEGESAVPNSLV